MSKREADDLMSISITFLKNNGYLYGSRSGVIYWTFGSSEKRVSIGITSFVLGNNPYIKFGYSQLEDDGTRKNFDYAVHLLETPCNFGGYRYWFKCINCGRCVGVLYKDGDYFACRHCYDLTYRSRNESKRVRSSPIFRALDLVNDFDDLKAILKRSHYAGKPTRKQRKMDKLRRKIAINNFLL